MSTDLTGTRVGRLAVIEPAVTATRSGDRKWRCVCECGKETVVSGSNLRRGRTLSCGCLRHETKSRLKHGMQRSSEYAIWNGIKGRCENPRNPAYSRYGGRGITMHSAWSASFEAFLADVGMRPSKDHSIDRVDNERGYEPGNVRWATRSEQVRNSSKFKGGANEATRKAEMAEDIIRLEREKAEAQAEALKLRSENRALMDEIERLRSRRDWRFEASHHDEHHEREESLRAQLAAMTAARDKACEIAEGLCKYTHAPRVPAMLAELRKVGT